MTPSELQAIRNREQRATDGPWETHSEPGSEAVQICSKGYVVAELGDEVEHSDAEFMAHARSDVPALRAEMERLATERAAVIRALGIEEDIDMGRDLVEAARSVADGQREAIDMMLRAEAERDEARKVALDAVAAVKAYAEELNGEPTEHLFDEIVARWKAAPTAPTSFYILSVKHSPGNEMGLLWWRPNNAGYTCNLNKAGRYAALDVERNSGYYNNGESTVAIPVSVVEGMDVWRVLSCDMLQAACEKVGTWPPTPRRLRSKGSGQ